MIVLKSYLIKVIVANASHQANAVFPTHIHILAARGGRCVGAIWATHYKLGEIEFVRKKILSQQK